MAEPLTVLFLTACGAALLYFLFRKGRGSSRSRKGRWQPPLDDNRSFDETLQDATAAAESSAPRLEARTRDGNPGRDFELQYEIVATEYEDRKDRLRNQSSRQFAIEYADANGVITTRIIFVYSVSGSDKNLIRAWCFLREAHRTFRNDRILSAKTIDTGRSISDLASYVQRSRYRLRK